MQQIEHEIRPRDESDALRTRVLILEAALACVVREADRALDEPDLLLTSMCRVSAVARQAAR